MCTVGAKPLGSMTAKAASSVRFGDLLRRHRLRLGFSQSELAEKASLSLTAVGALERGTRQAPYRDTVSRLADALGLDGNERDELEMAAARARARPGSEARELRDVHLPHQRTSFVGRDDEIGAVRDLLSGSRLVTLTGSGGVGKTRLAIEAARGLAHDRWDEVWFVDLSPLTDGAFIAERIASTVLAPLTQRVETIEVLAHHLSERRMLLVLDNCEHLSSDVAVFVHLLLQASSAITILATGRERLRAGDEAVYRVPSLRVPSEVPDTLDDARTFAALDLFIKRAESSDAQVTFTSDSVSMIVDVCRRLEGIPLAIELAASRLGFLGLRALRERLDDHFALPSSQGVLPPRQQTVMATIAWSCDLLSKPERDLLYRFCVFAGGFTLEAAEAVCVEQPRGRVLQVLSSLADRSLVTPVYAEDRVRYTMLESVRAYGLDQLDKLRRRITASRRHGQWIAEVADRAGAVAQQMSYQTFLGLIAELDNARAAMAWALNSASHDDRAIAGRIVSGFRSLWRFSHLFSEHRRWLDATLERISEERHPLVVAEVLRTFLIAAFYERAVLAAADRARALFESHGDARSIAIFHLTAMHIYSTHRRLDDASASCERADVLLEAEGMRSTMWYAGFLINRATLRIEQGRFPEAKTDCIASAELAAALGDDYYAVSRCLPRLYQIEMERGDFRAAAAIVDRMRVGPFGEATEIEIQGLEMLSVAWLLAGEAKKAADVARRVLQRTRGETTAWYYIVPIVALAGNREIAATLMGFTNARFERSDHPPDEFIRRSREILERLVRTHLSKDVIAARIAAGAVLSERQACDLALAALNP